MKNLIIISALAFSFSSFASDLIGGGGGTLEFNKNEIEAVTTFDGDYARWEDLEEGFVQFRGALIREGKIYLNLNEPRFEIESVILNSGLARHLSGGDMGGGGKVIQ